MSFDRLAPHYRWMECVLAGNKLQRCRTAFLSRVKEARNVLILGEGNGRFLVEARRVLASANITCVDASVRMLQLAQGRLSALSLSPAAVSFVHADALNWIPPKQSYDVVVSHFFLDCFQPAQLAQLLATISHAAMPEAIWLLADFQIPRRWCVCRWRAQLIHGIMYAFFRVFTNLPARRLTEPDPFLQAHGYQLRERLVVDWGLLRSDLWQRGPT
jgi:ubiquinone/menaquinone biosynthesis C-methylase UbiE